MQSIPSYKLSKYLFQSKNGLDESLVRPGGKGLGDVVVDGNNPGLSGLSRESLEQNLLALFLGLLLLGGVGLDTVKELLSALGVTDVLNSDVDTLLHVSTVDDLVDDHTNSSGGNVVNDTGLAVVELVGHTLLLRRVGLDVNDVTNSVGDEEGGDVGGTVLLETPPEHVARSRSHTERVRHLDGLLLDFEVRGEGNRRRTSIAKVV